MSNKYNKLGHWAMGFASQFVNGRYWWLHRREIKQLPPENDRYPVRWIPIGDEYWSKARVMDTLNDSTQYDEGGTLGWFVVVALSVKLGMWL